MTTCRQFNKSSSQHVDTKYESTRKLIHVSMRPHIVLMTYPPIRTLPRGLSHTSSRMHVNMPRRHRLDTQTRRHVALSTNRHIDTSAYQKVHR